MPSAYQLTNTLDLSTANLSDAWLGADYPTGSTSAKFSIAALKAHVLASATGSTDLGVSHLSGTVLITSSTGADTTLLAATTGAAGVMLPAHVVKLNNITVTAPINLDALSTSNHAAANAANSSVVVNPTTQAINVQLGAISGQTNRLQLLGNGLYVQSSDLGVTYSLSTVNITCATGTPISITEASSTQAGVMSNTLYNKLAFLTVTGPINLDTLSSSIHFPATAGNASVTVTNGQAVSVNLGAVSGTTNQLSIQGGGLYVPPTNITAALASTSVTINSSTGSGVLLAQATTTNAGVLSAADKTKLNLLTATASVNLDTLASLSHAAASAANASILVTGQAINVRISATSGNGLSLNADGLYVSGSGGGGGDYAVVANMAALPGTPSTGARRRVTTNRLTFTYTGAAWEPDSLRIKVTNSQFAAITEAQIGQEVIITDTDTTQLNTTSGWTTTGVGPATQLLTSYAITQTDIDNANVQLVGANIAARVFITIGNLPIDVWISTDGSAPSTADAIFTPSTGVLTWSGRVLVGKLVAGMRIQGVYKPL